MNNIRLAIPASADYVDVVRLCLYGLASKSGYSFEEIEDMKVAVAEACNNVVLHAYPAQDDGEILVTFVPAETSFTIRIKDNGRHFFDPGQALEQAAPIQAGEAKELQVGGLGIYLMKALMDEVAVESDQGTEVTLVKYKSESRIHG